MIRLIGYFFGIGTVLFLIVAAGIAWYIGDVSKDLPDYEVLNSYEPPVTTRVHASSGELMAEYARERRLFLPIQAIPDRVKAAFLSAEDKNFYHHPGVDPVGLARAVVNNIRTGGRQGASTITQQVAKNFLLSSDQTYERKIKEAILSFRIEQAYSKDRILELYLNEIFFGLNSYGIAGAALTYFNKSVNELTIAETAYLAALPKAPNNYHPFRHTERAVERRNWVIDRMVENGYVRADDGADAKAQPLGVTPRKTGSYLFASEYFAEEVRRELIGRYGNDALYEGGLSVRTTLDPRLQAIARKALQKGLISYDERRGFRGPVERIDISGDWGVPLAEVDPLRDVPEWQLAVVLSASADAVEVGLRPGREVSGKVEDERVTGTILADNMKWAFRLNLPGEKATNVKSAADVLNPGDVVYVQQLEQDGEQVLRLRQPPKVQGALVAMDPHTGRVLAMVGGSPSPSRSSTAPPRPSASPVRPSSRLSTLPLSTMAIRLLPWFSMRRSKSFPVASFGSPRTMAAAPPARQRSGSASSGRVTS
jgi:penicillin-binding protein 1A